MMMPHPLLPMGLPPASVAMAMSQMNHLNTIANMAAAAQQIHTHVHRAPVIKVELLLELNYVDKTLKEDQRKFSEEFFKNVSMLFQLMFLQEQ